jgi:AcrR family transcriptional regulator
MSAHSMSLGLGEKVRARILHALDLRPYTRSGYRNEMSVSRQNTARPGPERATATGPPAAGNRPSASGPTAASQNRDPRANQRERTRTAIMDGACKLLAEGQIPSIADAAEQARVSRATAYRYFPSQSALIQEAVEATVTRRWEPSSLPASSDVFAGHIERHILEMLALVREHEALLRGALLLSLQQWAKLQAGGQLAEEPIKRGGRIPAIQAALDPYRNTLDPAGLRRLAIALSLLVGAETRTVLHDIWKLDDGETEQVTLWIARTLAQATQASSAAARS